MFSVGMPAVAAGAPGQPTQDAEKATVFLFVFLLQIEAAIVQRKKVELLKRYATSSLMEEEETVKKMLGV